MMQEASANTTTNTSEGRRQQQQQHSNKQREWIPFEDCFGSLAYHLFPDGCPSSDDDDELQSVWPQPKSRAVVSAKEALTAIKRLQRLGKHRGFTCPQQQALVLVATATLPCTETEASANNNNSSDAMNLVVKNSPLRDESNRHFQTLLQATIPQPNHPISSTVVLRLVSVCQKRQQQQTVDSSSLGITSCVLHFLTLAIRNGALSAEARQTLSSLYSIFFSWTMNDHLCADAVRLLHALTRQCHVRVYRAKRLRDFYDHACSSPDQQQYNFSPLLLLLQLYARCDPIGCGEYFWSSKQQRNPDLKRHARWFAFPNVAWEKHFHNVWHNNHNQDVVNASEHPGDNNNNNNHNIIDNNDDDRPLGQIPKRQKTSSSSTTTVEMLQQLSDSFEGVHSFSTRFGPNKTRALRASDLLQDPSVTQLMLFASSPENEIGAPPSDPETARLRVCLPFMLEEEWYEVSPPISNNKNGDGNNANSFLADDTTSQNTSSEEESSSLDSDASGAGEGNEEDKPERDDSKRVSSEIRLSSRAASRVRILESLAAMATQTGMLVSESVSMILNDILPTWDGTEEWGVLLCYDILPFVTSGCKTFPELRNKVLMPLQKLFLYGSPKLQRAILSGTLTSLVLNLAKRVTNVDERRTLMELIQWSDDLMLQAIMMAGEEGGVPELLSGAVVDFFRVVCLDVTRHCSFIVLPSTSLVYRLLLGPTAVSLDRTCQLLVDYKESFQKLKQRLQENLKNAEASFPVEGLDQVALFNCFVWDFCSVLWQKSPLPATDIHDDNDRARRMSILFTDINPETLQKLHVAPEKANVVSALSITHGSMFAQHASEFLRQTLPSIQIEEESLRPDRLKGKLKQKFLDYLKDHCAMDGLYAFLTNFVGSLAEREKRKRKASDA